MSGLTQSPHKGVGNRTKLRKGTHSCQECRLRKTRCVPSPDNLQTCTECFARGVHCRGQDRILLPLDDRPTLKERVAKLEQLIKSFEPGRRAEDKFFQTPERDVAETLNNLRCDGLPPAMPSTDVLEVNSNHHENPPILSLFHNAILTRNDASLLENHTPSDNIKNTSKSKLSWARIRQTFFTLLPSTAHIDLILEAIPGLWGSWQRMFPEIDTGVHETLKQFVFWGLGQENPTHVGMALLCLATVLYHLGSGLDEYHLALPLPRRDLISHYFDVVDRLIIADHEFAVTDEGVNIIIFRAKCHFNLGQPRKCWLLFRRAISIAQLLGLDQNRRVRLDESTLSVQRRVKAWKIRYLSERYTSLLLGLPYAVVDGNEPECEELRVDCLSPSEYLHQMLYPIVGRIIDRNRTSKSPPLILTFEIDQKMEDIVNNIPSTWWNTESLRSATSSGAGEYFKSLMAQFWYFQIKSLLHLPFMLQCSTDRRVEYSRSACFHASRELIRLYHIMRKRDDDVGFHLCRVIDYQCLIATVILMLGVLGYGDVLSEPDHHGQERDLQLVLSTTEILRRLSSEEGNHIATQSLHVLETLYSMKYKQSQGGNNLELNWSGKLIIPYFGTITISTNDPHSTMLGIQKTQRNSMQLNMDSSPEFSNISRLSNGYSKTAANRSNDASGISSNIIEPGAISEYPHIDIDWQSMINIDLDEDWNSNMDGTVV